MLVVGAARPETLGAMRVLMLGWDFSPRLSGGVGTACQGIANALSRSGVEVLFVLPHLRGDEEPENVALRSMDELEPAPRAARTALPASVPSPSASAQPERAPPAPARIEPAPALLSSAESLRLLAIDSPLRPYQSASDYARVVHELFARLRPEPAPSVPARRAASGDRPPSSLPAARESAPSQRSPAGPRRVPPYGATLGAEVERYARAVLRIAEREPFDLLHAHDWMSFPAGLLVREVTRKPLVAHFHSSELERRGPAADPEIRAVEQAMLAGADRIVCVSRRSARALREDYRVELARVRVVHNAFSPPADTSRSPRNGRAPVVLYLGRLAQQKGPEVFLAAAARVHEQTPEARFVMAGAGELYPEVVQLAQELGLQRALRFTGFVTGEELARTYAQADVYVMPSAAEPFGITSLEAASMGVPVIVSRQAGVTEVLRSCLRFDPWDVEGLADKILALLKRPALRAQLVEQGLHEVKKIRWDRPARALRGIYDELVA